jgi:hypothetical protein
MDSITATELELLECFGVEPKLLGPGFPWWLQRRRILV